MDFPDAASGKEHICLQEIQIWPLVWADPLEEGMAAQSSILVWRISWTEELDRPQSKLQRVGHDGSNLACMNAYICTYLYVHTKTSVK